MKKILDLVFTAIIGLLFIPTILIMISWNSIPGDPLYNLKRSLEDITLAITKKVSIGSSLSIDYTARRFSEANRLLAKDGSTLGYQYLIEGTEVSKQIIFDQKDTEKGTELVKKIEEYQVSIEERKTVIQTDSTTTLLPQTQTVNPTVSTPIPTAEPTEQPQINVQTAVPVSTTPPATQTPVTTQITSVSKTQVLEDLQQTNDKLEKIKNEIKKELPEDNKGGKSSDSNDKNNENKNKGQGQHDNNNP